MKKKILAFILSGCILMQNSGLAVQAAELPLYTQVQTGEIQEGNSEVQEDSTASGRYGEDDVTDTFAETGSGDEASEGVGDETAAGEEPSEGADDENMPGNGEEALPGTEDENESGENPDASIVVDGEEGSEDKNSEENMTSVSEDAPKEDIGEAISIQDDSVEESTKDIHYAYYEIPEEAAPQADADIEALNAAQSIADVKGLYFGYVENDSKKHTGTLKEYISDAETVVIPHKLDKTYMVEIGDGAFKGMDDKDTSDTTKLPSQSTTNKSLLSSGEMKILEKVNAERIKKDKVPLVMNKTLRETARCKTLDMFNRNYFKHEDPNGIYSYKWMSDCGFPVGGHRWAENIAYNTESAEKLYTQWYNSSGHYKNMMGDNYRSIGIGVYKNSDGKIMGTQIFSDVIFQNITSVTIEFGYEKIGNQAFSGCSNLKTITIPSTVTEIAANAFDGCKKLTIRGKEGSYAETYAAVYGITFKAVNEKNPIEKFGFKENDIFMEVGDWDFAELSISPADYEHLIKIEKPGNLKDIVDMQEDGTIHAFAKGTVTIKAHAADLEDTCTITVGVRPPINIKRISFYDEELVLYEGESIKPLYKIEPVNATDSVKLTSSDAGVFVINEDDPSLITAVKAGKAELTVSGMDSGGNVTQSAVVNVRVLTENNALAVPEGLKTLTNITPTLAQVPLPEGFSWKEPQTKLKASDKEPVQYFAAQYMDDERNILKDCTIPLTVSKASGMLINMDGKSLASGNKLSMAGVYELIPDLKSTGSGIDISFYDVSVNTDAPNVLDVEEKIEGEKRSLIITPKSSGKCSVTIELRLKDAQGGYGPSNKPYGKYKKKYKFQVETAEYVNDFQIKLEPEEQTGVMLLGDGSIQVDEGVDKFRISTTPLGADGAVSSTALKYKADKSGVVKVGAVKGQVNVAEVTVKKTGEAHIFATAQDAGKRSRDITVFVKKMKPQVTGKSWVLNKLKPYVSAFMDIQEAEDNPIQDIILYEDKGMQKVANLFSVQRSPENGTYEIGFIDGKTDNVSKGSYKLFMKTVTGAGDYVYPITVKLKNNKPSVSLKQPDKINLFYKDAMAGLEINTGKEKLSEITQINVANSGPRFEADFEQKADGSWRAVLYPVGVNNSNYKSIAKTIELKFVFEGYGSAYTITKKLSVKSCYKKAQLAATYPQTLIYSTTGSYQTVIKIMDKSSGSILTNGGDDNVAMRLDNSMNGKLQMTVEEGAQDIHLELLNTKLKSLNAKIIVSHDNWLEEQSCPVKIDVNSQTPSFALEATKISLNANLAGKEVVNVRAFASKNEKVQVVRLKEIDIVGTTSAAKKLINEDKLIICPQRNDNERSLQICLNSGNVKAGTYKYNVYGWCMLGDKRIQRMNPVELSIAVTNRQPSASMKTKGKINIEDPENTEIIYTPNLTNAIGNIKSASLRGAYASQFRIFRLSDGTYKVKLKGDARIGKGKYKLYFTFILDNGIKVDSKAVTVKL